MPGPGLTQRVKSAITQHGATATFPGTSGGVYDPATDTWSGGAPGADATGRAIQTKDDPEQFTALGLTMTSAITLLVAADAGAVPAVGNTISWAGVTYTIRNVEPSAPSGAPVYWTVVAQR